MAVVPFTPSPTIIATEVVSYDGREVSFEALRVDKRKCTAENLALDCARANLNRKASEVSNRLFKAWPDYDAAVYVIAPSSGLASKVGFSSNPIKRLESLQGGSHEQMHITHLFWMPRRAAKGVEGLTLRVLGRLGVRLKGEWCSYSPNEAATAIAAVAVQGDFAVATSWMYLANYERVLDACGCRDHSDGYRFSPERALSRKRVRMGIDF